MTKKQKKSEDAKRRGSWFGVNPITKVTTDKKKQASKYVCRNKIKI